MTRNTKDLVATRGKKLLILNPVNASMDNVPVSQHRTDMWHIVVRYRCVKS